LDPQQLEPYIARMAIKESEAPVVGDKGLQAGALGLVGNVVIGLSAVAPALSLAATRATWCSPSEKKHRRCS
jgi:hypothetical protein